MTEEPKSFYPVKEDSNNESFAESTAPYDNEEFRNEQQHESIGGELLRSVTQYTEFSATQGTEAEPIEPTSQHGFFSKENTTVRRKFYKMFGVVLLALCLFILGVFSIYWGSMYGRTERLRNLKVLVVLEDQDSNGDYPFLSDAIFQVTKIPSIEPLLGWEVYNRSTIEQWTTQRSNDHGLSINEEIIRRVHRQTYWSSIYLESNDVSQSLLQSIKSGNSSFNTSSLINVYYETGRDFQTMSSYVNPFVKNLERAFTQLLSNEFYPQIISNLTSSEFENLRTSAPRLLTSLPTFSYRDNAEYSNSLLLAPLQVGIIYLIILTFFQFMWFMQVHGNMAPHLKPKHYILYRIICSQVAFLILSLIYSCVNAAFKVNFNKSWKGGFGIEWMISYLTMSAVGGANENIALLCFSTIPPLMGFWLLFWVVINISPTFSPLALQSVFYRYGYALPIHNTNEAMKCLLFDIWRGELGRNIGILVCWSVLNIILLPFFLMLFARNMKKKAEAAAAAEEKAKDERSKKIKDNSVSSSTNPSSSKNESV